MDRSMSWSELPLHHRPTYETEARHSSTDPPTARARSKSQGPPSRRGGQKAPAESSFHSAGPRFAWDTDNPIFHDPARVDPASWTPSSSPRNSVTTCSLVKPAVDVPATDYTEEPVVPELEDTHFTSCAVLEGRALKLDSSSSVISQNHDKILDSFPPESSSVAVSLELTQRFEEQEAPVPSTPIPTSNSGSGTVAMEHAPRRQSRGEAPRHFLISEKRTTPKGFKQLRNRAVAVTPDHKPAYSLGDGFSEYEAIPTGIVHVGSKRKFTVPSFALGQLELTQTTNVAPAVKEKRRRFIRIRKRDRREDNSFDFADVQLTPRIAKRHQKEAVNDLEIIEPPPQSSETPVLAGETDGTEQRQEKDPAPPAVNVELLGILSNNVKASSSDRETPLDPVATDWATSATSMLNGGEMMHPQM